MGEYIRTSSTNDETWDSMIYSLELLSDPDDSEAQKNAWKWIEELHKSKRLRQTDIIALAAVIENVYRMGLERGREEAS